MTRRQINWTNVFSLSHCRSKTWQYGLSCCHIRLLSSLSFFAILLLFMTVNWEIHTIHSLQAQTIQVGSGNMAADWLIKKENPIYASTFHIPRPVWYAWFNTKFKNLTWGGEYCQASESQSLNPSVSVRGWVCCSLPQQSRLHCRVRQMLKLNEDVLSHFLLLFSTSAQITVFHSLLSLPFPPSLPLWLCPILFFPLPGINSAVHDWLLYDSTIFHRG